MATKYDRIATDLRRQIHSGTLQPGQRLPAETTLADDYKVSLLTLRRALDVLDGEGLIEKRHGIGNLVRMRRPRIRRTTDRYQWEKDRVRLPEALRLETGATEYDTGLSYDDLMFEADYREVEADATLAEVFGVPVGTPLLRRTYRTHSRDKDGPLTLGDSYLLRGAVEANPALLSAENEPWPGGTQHQLSTVGIELDRIVDEITARPPSLDEAEALGIGSGVALIVLRKISIDTTGRVVEVADVLMAGDRSELVYSTQLDRW